MLKFSKSMYSIMVPTPRPSQPRTLVLFPGALGDFICFMPVLERLGRSSRIDLAARTEFADLVASDVTVRSIESYEISRLFVRGGAADERVKNFFASYESVYSWLGSAVPDFARQLMSLTQGRACLFPFRPLRGSMHQCDYYLRCVGESPDCAAPRVLLKADGVAWCESYWEQHALADRPVLALAPGSGARQKNWPVSGFATVAQWWREQTHGAVIVIIGPVEEDRGGYGPLRADALLVGNLRLAQVAALLSRCDLYIGNDSGMTHLAASLGASTVAIFGPSDTIQWAPRGEKVMIVTRNEECSPCPMPTMKECEHRRCLTALEPVTVIGELQRLLRQASLTRRRAGITVKH